MLKNFEGSTRDWVGLESNCTVGLAIHYFHMDHNAPCLPPRILHNHCFQYLQGREIENIGFGGGGGGGGG